MDNNLQRILFHVIEQLSNFERDFSKVDVKEINKAIYSFNNLLITKGINNLPTNIPEFINCLQKKTLLELGFNEKEATVELANENIIKNGRISITFKNWYDSVVSLSEEEQKSMAEFLQHCRKYRKAIDEEKYCNFYREGRSFVNKDNMVMSNMEFHNTIQKKFPSELRKILNKWRKDLNIHKEFIYICPICGKQVEFTFGNENSCSDICNYYISKRGLEFEKKIIKENEQYSQFTEGIYKFILLPGIGENLIYNKLLTYTDIEVELYPNMDEYDLRLIIDESELLLDIKDVSTPFNLIEILKKNNGFSKLQKSKGKNKYLVIPEHRRAIYFNINQVDYKRELLNILNNEGIDVEVLYEKDLYRKINLILKNDF